MDYYEESKVKLEEFEKKIKNFSNYIQKYPNWKMKKSDLVHLCSKLKKANQEMDMLCWKENLHSMEDFDTTEKKLKNFFEKFNSKNKKELIIKKSNNINYFYLIVILLFILIIFTR